MRKFILNFLTETGAIISENNKALTIVDGTPGMVEFPEEFIWDIHKFRPGHVLKLAHTHPTGMSELSGRDKQTLKTWSFALYPFPMRMSTLTWVESSYVANQPHFLETTYLGILEPKETWLLKKEKDNLAKRDFRIITESHEWIDFYSSDWKGLLLRKSFEH